MDYFEEDGFGSYHDGIEAHEVQIVAIEENMAIVRFINPHRWYTKNSTRQVFLTELVAATITAG